MTNTMTKELTGFSKENIQTAYSDLASDYNRKLWIEERLLGVKGMRQRLIGLAQGDVLEVACGTGLNFALYGPISSLTAVDLSPEMLSVAEKEAEKLGLAAAFQVMDAETLSFEDNSFDTVVSTLSTCTFPDPIAALQEMSRVCRPGGRILLLEHGRSSFRPLAFLQDKMAQSHYENAGCRWNQEPEQLIKTAGLDVVSSKRAAFGVFHTIQVVPG